MKAKFFKPVRICDGSILAKPFEGSTETYISLGAFDTEQEAINAQKYIKTKYVRLLLSVAKVTQDNTRKHWQFVPMQDFTDASDIDWNKSLDDIDTQLFDKYGLSLNERLWIRTHIASLE